MKFILTGTTGFVGGEVLAQCRRNPAISSIVVLTRRPLPDPIVADPKVQTIVLKDFKSYPADVVKQLEDADACIWTLGARVAIPEVEIDYPLAFARAIAPTRTSQQTPFRYIYCSGILAERDQTKPLWVSPTNRRVKGAAENSMIEFEEQNKGRWETYIVKPALIRAPEGDILKSIRAYLMLIGTVRVNELAAAMIDIVSRGNKQQTFLNAEIISTGQAALGK
ncbi:hypothetical protein B0H16DRAFT_1899112 [Mycena metata]|uniref:NAD(P)-binding domain-containing protein n=1 Tax=Mycena metata TaxID=1033252 RepID=A0AAD7MFN3_9AGAR|nr:hypothetical protein B0H16DRAFT_1899112 [Mycena metata]